MKRGKATAVGMAVGMIAGGCGQQADTTSELSPQQPAECVSIRVGPNLLSGPEHWAKNMGYVAFQPFWRSELGLHAAWLAFEARPFEAGSGSVPGSTRLVISSLSAQSGELLDNQFHNLYPDQSDALLNGIIDASGAPDGSYAVAYNYAYHISAGGPQKVLFGHVLGGATAIWSPSFSDRELSLFDVGWDGEAFAVHGASSADGSVYLIRLSPDGTVVLEPTKVGAVTVLWANNFDAETDPDTGITVIVSPGPKGVIVMGHDRQGRMLQGMPPEGWTEIRRAEDQYREPGFFPAVALGPQSFMIAWLGERDYTFFQPVTYDLQLLGTPSSVAPDKVGSPVRARYWLDYKTLSRQKDRWSLAGHATRTIDAVSVTEDGSVIRRALISHSPSECVETNTCPNVSRPLQADHFTSVVWKDELWFGFMDNSGDYAPVRDPINQSPYRIVRVKDGCTYPSEYDRLTGN